MFQCKRSLRWGKSYQSGKPNADSRNLDWLVKGFKNVFGKYLLVTNVVSSVILMCAGDLIQQEIEHFRSEKHKNSFDWQRNIHMGLVGILLGPFSHFFYQLLDKYMPGTKISSIAKKIFLDQSIASPISILIFFFGMNYLNDRDFKTSKAELKEKFWIIYAVDCSLWIPFQFFNFYCVSSQYRVTYVNVVTMCYNVFLSFAKHQESNLTT